MDTTWTFTIPMAVLIGVPSAIFVLISSVKIHHLRVRLAIRRAKERRIAHQKSEERLEQDQQAYLAEKKQKVVEEKAQQRKDLPEEWRVLLMALKDVPQYLQLVWFQESLKENILPQLSAAGAEYFMNFFAHYSCEWRDAAVKAMGPHLDIGIRNRCPGGRWKDGVYYRILDDDLDTDLRDASRLMRIFSAGS